MAKKKGFINTTTMVLKETLAEKEKEFYGKDDIMGVTLLTNPGYISSSRSVMFTSHVKQAMTLLYPDFPKIFTNYEKFVGKHSTGYYKSDNDYVVVDKICKYGDADEFGYLLFLYSKEEDRYIVVEKRNVENLTEKFGYVYNTENMDSKEIGQTVHKDEVLYRSSSYDESMNYGYGKNTKFMYTSDPDTIEDAIVCSRSYADTMLSKEVETVTVSLNDNDILCNLYGDNDVYKGFPDVGESTKDKIVLSKRRIHNNQVLYDLKASNLRKVNFSSDIPFFCGGRVIDIEIFSNRSIDELADSRVYDQIKKYMLFQKDFHERIYEITKKIIDSGSDYSKEINFYYQKSKMVLDENVKWRKEESVFSNMMIRFVIERSVGLSIGQKITGRYGNKGVISKILPDEDMPVLETGERIDVLFNTLGVINRTNTFQFIENSITFICNRLIERMSSIEDLDEREKLFFSIMDILNSKQSQEIRKYLCTCDKKEFFDGMIADKNIYVHIPPLWEEDEVLFDRINRIYLENPWIKPYNVFIKKFGRMIKIMKPLIVGDMYVMKLQQSSEKGFSARSTGSLSKKGVPEKTNKSKLHQDLYPHTPIKMGDQECINLCIGVDSWAVAKLHQLYRTSVKGRKKLGEALITNYDGVDRIDGDLTNRNAEILTAYLKSMGYKIARNDKIVLDAYDESIDTYEYGDKTYLMDRESFDDMRLKDTIMLEELGNIVQDRDSMEDEVQRLFANYKRQNKITKFDK